MIEDRKDLPAGAELSSAPAESQPESSGARDGLGVVNLTDIAVYLRMRELSLRAARWHRHCVQAHPGESA
jgi:hypothetical protein